MFSPFGSNRNVPVPRNLYGLQAGRAIAALLVVLFHTSLSIFALPKYWGHKPFGKIFDFGDSGVFFFFVLSGFIIFHAHYRDLNHPERVRGYIWKRFRRIYPIYWVVLLLTLPVYFAVPSFGKGFETQTEVILSSAVLVHLGSVNAVILVSWTLFHEILFYALFGLAIWRLRLGRCVIALWFAVSIWGLATDRSRTLAGFYFSDLHLLFGMGMAAAWWIRHRSLSVPVATAMTGVAVFLFAGADEAYWHIVSQQWRMLLFGLGATLAVAGMVELERGMRLRIPSWLRLLGDASYSIYLVHFFALSLFAKLLWACGVARLLPESVSFVLLACAAVAAGTLCHLGVERPLLARLGQKFTARTAPVPIRPG